MLFSILLAALGMASSICAAPTTPQSTLTADDLIKISSNTTSCAGASFPDECVDAVTAAPNIAVSFINFQIDSFGAQAALVAIMLFESGDFKYSKNHYPGVAGQGTRNMQSPTFNEKYATWLATVCANCGITMEDVTAAKAKGPEAVLELVNTDEWSFGSAAWFLRTQCDASFEKGLASGTQTAFQAYIEKCVGTTLTDDRVAGWKKVMALKQW